VALAGARRYWLIWVAVVPIVLWTLVRVFALDGGFPLAPLMAFTPYAAIAALFAAGLGLALRNWAAAAVAGLATLCLAAAVLPRAVGDGTVEAAGHETLNVLSANIHHGTSDPEALVALVDRFEPDLLSVQELTPSFARKLRRAGLGARLPEAIVSVRAGASGAGLYSRLPMTKIGNGGPFFFRMPRARLELPDGRAVRVAGVHPYPPTEGNEDIWEEALKTLPSAGAGPPWVLAGDFNGTFDQSEFRAVVDRGYRDAGAVAGKGLEPTWPEGAWASRLPPVTIDHVLADRRLGIVEYSVEEQPGSDHRAIHAVLALP
jgi:endonuclease/exonuclease/phosphatase family metal-dependent hydrolase